MLDVNSPYAWLSGTDVTNVCDKEQEKKLELKRRKQIKLFLYPWINYRAFRYVS